MTERSDSQLNLAAILRDLQEETLLSPERGKTLKGIVMLVGESNTGKTTSGRIAAEKLGVKIFGAGTLFRAITGIDTGAFMERDPRLDARVDGMVAKIVKNSANFPPTIIDSHLGGHIVQAQKEKLTKEARKKKKKPPVLPVKTILLTASEEERWRRAWNEQIIKEPGVTLEEVAARETDRAHQDMPFWRINHPSLKNPYNPAIFDIVINTEGKTIEEVADEIISALDSQDFLVPVPKIPTSDSKSEPNTTPPLPDSGIVFARRQARGEQGAA